MENFRLIKLITNDLNISFNENINYILGDNNSGKTILIETLQYGLGLIKKSSNLSDILGQSTVKIECLIGNNELTISRENRSKSLNVNGYINEVIKIDNKEIEEFYNKLLQPNFINEVEDHASAYNILQGTFMTDLSYLKSKRESDVFKRVMGIDFSYLSQLKKEISIFEKDIYQEKFAFNLLDNYMSKVNESIKEVEEKYEQTEGMNEVKDILIKEYKSVNEEHHKNIQILKEAKDLLRKRTSLLTEILNERINIFSPLFNEIYLELTGEVSDISFSELIEGKLLPISASRRELVMSALYLTFFAYKIDKFHNSCCFFVVDVSKHNIDKKIFRRYKEIVEKIVMKNGIQYIETTTLNSYENSNKKIIINLNENGKIYE